MERKCSSFVMRMSNSNQEKMTSFFYSVVSSIQIFLKYNRKNISTCKLSEYIFDFILIRVICPTTPTAMLCTKSAGDGYLEIMHTTKRF